MLSLFHTLISLPFGVYMQNPLLIFLAAAAMHFLCDTLLHWNIYPANYKSYPFHLVALDIAAGLVLAYFLTGPNFLTLPILAAIAGGNMPDILHGLWEFSDKKRQNRLAWVKPLFAWHDHIQLETANIQKGLISQLALAIIAIALIV